MKMCAIFDSKAEAWMTPLFFQATGQAIRSFGDAVNETGSEFNKHPEDYTLFLLGEFDPQGIGLVSSLPAPVPLVTGIVASSKDGDSTQLSLYPKSREA